MGWRRILVGGLASAVAAVGLALVVGARRQQRALVADVDRLLGDAGAATRQASRLDDLDAPPPVVRYLRQALLSNASIRLVRLQQIGRLRTDARGDRWMAFEAEHVAAPAAVGFVWNARVRIAPLLHVRVRDALIAGEGSGQVALLSAFTVAHDAGTPEMHSGSLHRYLAEAVWYPTALLPGPGLRWDPVDGNTALATLTSHGLSVSLEFRFSDTGEVAAIYTAGRWGTFGDRYAQVPWEGHFRDYQDRDGVRIPLDADVGWYVDGQWQPVWEGRITTFDAEY